MKARTKKVLRRFCVWTKTSEDGIQAPTWSLSYAAMTEREAYRCASELRSEVQALALPEGQEPAQDPTDLSLAVEEPADCDICGRGPVRTGAGYRMPCDCHTPTNTVTW